MDVRIVVKNLFQELTAIHWHGLQIPNDQYGPGDMMAQAPIEPGKTFS